MANQNVTILNWNIQNFGKTKAQYSDIVNGIASMVVRANPIPDIFVLVELNTTVDATAQWLAKKLAKALNAQSLKINNRDEFQVYVLSPNTGVEYYAFFIRDATLTKPLIPVNTVTNNIALGIGNGYTDQLTTVVFKEQQLTGGRQLINGFCLYAPDLYTSVKKGKGVKKVTVPAVWPAKRLQALGMFWCETAKRLLPIMACHYAAKHKDAKRQFNTLKYFSLLDGMAPSAGAGSAPKGIPLVKLQMLKKGVTNVRPGAYVLTGDFNLDYTDVAERGAYNVIEGNASPHLDATVINTVDDTLLMTYGVFNTDRPKSPDELPNRDYDNFCLRVSPTAGFTVTSGNLRVYLTPEEIRTRGIRLLESVWAYAKLDKRGFISNQYSDMGINFANQIGGDKNNYINIKGSLVGGRLISDHLPVAVTLTIT
jgi:hypothetical protein